MEYKGRAFLIFGFVAFIYLEVVSGLGCIRCDKVNCKAPLNCKGGLVKDPCHCCDVCAKVKGELCGGPWNYLGKCDEGLKCLPKTKRMFSSGKCGMLPTMCQNIGTCKMFCPRGREVDSNGCLLCKCRQDSLRG